MSILSPLNWFLGRTRYTAPDRERDGFDDRRHFYNLWDQAYDNSMYRRQREGGFREVILAEELATPANETEECVADISGHWNPIRPIVDLYQNLLPGQYGKDIGVAEQVNRRDVNPVLLDVKVDPIGAIWRKGNLDTNKQKLMQWGANLGTVGIRVVANPDDGSVYLKFDHPRKIRDYGDDDRGNLEWVELEWVKTIGRGKDKRDVTVVETFDRESFSVKWDEVEQLTDAEQVNQLGFVPYVIYQFAEDESGFGVPAHYGDLNSVHVVNWLDSNLTAGTLNNIDPQWFATAAGPAPQYFNFGRNSGRNVNVWYVQSTPDVPQPTADAIVPNINYEGIQGVIKRRQEEYRQRHPELVLGEIETLSGLSGESYAKLILPAEQKILERKTNLQNAMIRAMQMAFSYQIFYGTVNFGTGTGTKEAADRAYDTGALEFEFLPQSNLPQTADDKIKQVDLDNKQRGIDLTNAATLQRMGLPDEEVLKEAGYDDADVQRIMTLKATDGVVPTEDQNL